MKRKKTFAILIFTIVFFLGSMGNTNTIASEVKKDKPSQSLSGELDLSKAKVSEPMSYDELVSEYAVDAGVSLAEAKKMLGYEDKLYSTRSSYRENYNYRTISCDLNVSSTYKPQLKYYCRTSEWGSSWHGIIKIMTVNMYRYYNGRSYAFSGNVYSHLRDSNKIFFIVNGDFYMNGSTTVNGGLNIGIGEKGSVSFGASYTSNHYKYFYVEDFLRW